MKLAILKLFLLYAIACASALTCGNIGDDISIEPGDATSLTLGNSEPSSLCMLFRVTAISEAGDLSSLNKASNLADFNMAPVARSYAGKDWQRTAGAYAQDLEISCTSVECILKIPALPNLKDGRFVLLPLENPLLHESAEYVARASVSRFFQRNTFGPTLAMIDGWNYGAASMASEMASWVKNQINATVTSITSHREFFRKRVNGELERELQEIFKVRNPCDAGSRWTTYTFSTDDYDRYIDVSVHPDGGYLISEIEAGVVTVARTIVSEWKDEVGNDLGPGIFMVEDRMDEFLGGRLEVEDSTGRDSYILGGNPPVNLPANTANVTFVDLPSLDNFVQTPTITFNKYYDEIYDETLYLESDLTDESLCSNFNVKDSLHIIGNLANSNVQVRYGRYLELEDNTLSNPSASGSIDHEACPNPLMDWKNAESCRISNEESACTTREGENFGIGSAIVICGSPSEVSNDPYGQSIFSAARTTDLKNKENTKHQRESVWSMIAMSGETEDQLRQKVAWALSQILAISPAQIQFYEQSEIYLNYYDIFVKNAFTNYFDILKEVSLSPMMGEMLSYVGSKSKPFVLKDEGINAFPDENYAREVMQLFSIGLYKLNTDGTQKLDDQGLPILSYTAEDIQNFARAWTGFDRAPRRANVEAYWYGSGNRIDPMVIYGPWRDFSPKTDLDGGYIGDGYQLCTDLPDKHFLKKGANYQLTGSSKMPLLHTQPTSWFSSGYNIQILELNSSSELFSKLCNEVEGSCTFAPVITLHTNLSCDDDTDPECLVDDLRLVKVQGNPDVHYEYVRPACVEHAFYENSKTVQLQWPQDAMCANGDLALATDACCESPSSAGPEGVSSCQYSVEKTTFATSEARCASRFAGGAQCAWSRQDKYADDRKCHLKYEDNYYWASQELCQLQAKVSSAGSISIVHNPVLNPNSNFETDVNVRKDNPNYFSPAWVHGNYPDQLSCDSVSGCSVFGNDCLCTVTISETAVFSALPQTTADIFSELKIGGVDVEAADGYTILASTSDFDVYQKDAGGYDKDTVFKILNHFGEEAFFRNMVSMVEIGGGLFSFRNPVQFLNPARREGRDAQHETDAVLKHYVRHPNTAPFLAQRMIQRFGTSNPAPSYVEAVAIAFKEGTYSSENVLFGDGMYGSLEAMIAAIILHEEARSVVLDADPTSGSLREPLLKTIAFMRSMEFLINPKTPELRLLNLESKIGQMAHNNPSVFSFFLPEYSTPGHIEAASLAAPEGQVMNSQTLTSFFNGNFAMVELGLNDCYGGFGDYAVRSSKCDNLLRGEFVNDNQNRGSLNYSPPDTSSPSKVVEDIALLLTAGRLNSDAKTVLENAYIEGGLSVVQKLFIAIPEFHSTGIVNSQISPRPKSSPSTPSEEGYKAIVFLNLSGGADTFNMLVPHSDCIGKDMYAEYSAVRTVLALDKSSLLQINATGSGQVCDTFGLHPNLGTLQTLYNDGDLLFTSNIGVLQEYADKNNWRDKTDNTFLYSHSSQQEEIQRMDIFEEQAGRGVGGRMLDVLKNNGFKVNALSTRAATPALTSNFTPLIVVPSVNSYEKFDPMSAEDSSSDPDILINKIKELNKATNLGSSLFAETFSSALHQSLSENQLLYDTLQTVTVDTLFPSSSSSSSIGSQFETVSKMIKTKDIRGVDRDIFYVEQRGYDTHSNLISLFNSRTEDLDAAIDAFVAEMKIQGIWEEGITVVACTEFSRTLTTNTGAGSDHAYGSNLFTFGGKIEGGKILGQYPNDLTYETGPLIINQRGIVLPTTPYDALWNAVAQWFGVTDNNDLDEVLPNRNRFSLFSAETLYGSQLISSSPTTSTAPITSSSPSYAGNNITPRPSTSPLNDNVIDFQWNTPGSGGFLLQTVFVGDTVQFNWFGEHTVFISSEGICDGTLYEVGQITGTKYTFVSEGNVTFVCTMANHCNAGHTVTFNVLSTNYPTISPSKTPTLKPTLRTLTPPLDDEVHFIGNPCTKEYDSGKCPACRGDCDKDSDCEEGLRCAQRNGYDGNDKVPGCNWGPNSDDIRFENDDYCFLPIRAPGQINYVGGCSPAEGGYLCEQCEGHCSTDDDCVGNLICFDRSGYGAAPGCHGEGGDRDVHGQRNVCVAAPSSGRLSPTVAHSCVDDPAYIFVLDFSGDSKGCDWISKNDSKLTTRQDQYCETTQGGRGISDACCDACHKTL